MIYKNAEMNNRKDVTVVVFGTGDIRIVGIDDVIGELHGVLFSQAEPKDIENWNKNQTPIKSIEEAKYPVVLYFSKPESVDRLIDSLNKVKEQFETKQK